MAKKRIPRYRREAKRSERPSPPAPGAIIVADASRQAPNNSYSGRSFYQDEPFVCADCGKSEVWTARQQQWWYEVAKGSIYSTAKRCRECRKRRRESPPKPEKPIRVSDLIDLVRDKIEPTLFAAGFIFNARNTPCHPAERAWVDYAKAGELFSFSFKPGTGYLLAELLDQTGICRTVAKSDFDNPTTRAAVLATVAAFAFAVSEFMTRFEPAS
jgi:putative zinc ribbon protein